MSHGQAAPDEPTDSSGRRANQATANTPRRVLLKTTNAASAEAAVARGTETRSTTTGGGLGVLATSGQAMLRDRHVIETNHHEIGTDRHVIEIDRHEIETDHHAIETDRHKIGTDRHVIEIDHHEIETDHHVIEIDHHEIATDHVIEVGRRLMASLHGVSALVQVIEVSRAIKQL